MAKLIFRIRPTTIHDIFKKLMPLVTDQRKQILENCSVLQFLDYPAFQQNVPLIRRMLSLWNVEEEAFVICGRPMKFTSEDVALIIGMPNRGKKVHIGNMSPLHPKDSNKFKDEFRQIDPAATDEEFFRLFLQYVITNLFFISSNFRISSSYVNYANNLEEFSHFNWPEAIHAHLVNQITSYNSRALEDKKSVYIGGFLTILMIWFLEHTNVHGPDFPNRRPRMMRWSEKIHWKDEEIDSLFASLEASQLSEAYQDVTTVDRHLLSNDFLSLPEIQHFDSPSPPRIPYVETTSHPPNAPSPPSQENLFELIFSRLAQLEEMQSELLKSVHSIGNRLEKAESEIMELRKQKATEDIDNVLSIYSNFDDGEEVVKDDEDVVKEHKTDDNNVSEERMIDEEVVKDADKVVAENKFDAVYDNVSLDVEEVVMVTEEGVKDEKLVADELVIGAEEVVKAVTKLDSEDSVDLAVQNLMVLSQQPPKKKPRLECTIAFAVKGRDDRKKLNVKSPFTAEGKKTKKKGSKKKPAAKKLPKGKFDFIGRNEVDDSCLEFLEKCFEKFKDSSELVFRKNHIAIFREGMDRLMTDKELSDNHIDAFVSILIDQMEHEPESFQPFLYVPSVLHMYDSFGDDSSLFVKHINKKSLGEAKYIIVTVHGPGHWTLAVGVLAEEKWYFYDSFPKPGHVEDVPPVLQCLDKYLSKEFDSDIKLWPITVVEGLPRQKNGFDCGMYVCKYIETLVTAKEPVVWSDYQEVWAKNMHLFRLKLAFDIYCRSNTAAQ